MKPEALPSPYQQLMAQFEPLLESQFSLDAVPETFNQFLTSYYSLYPQDSLSDKPIEDVYGAAHDQWRFFCKRQKGSQPKIRVFNPSLEEEGWLSAHTLVWVLCKDMPFIVSSLRLEMQRCGISIHNLYSQVMLAERDNSGVCQQVSAFFEDVESEQSIPSEINKNNIDPDISTKSKEALVCFEINRISKQEDHIKLEEALANVLDEIVSVVNDYGSMQGKARDVCESFQKSIHQSASKQSSSKGDRSSEEKELVDFLTWLDRNHFTWLGYQFVNCSSELAVQDGLGLFRPGSIGYQRLAKEIEEGAKVCDISKNLISFSKSSIRSRIHRSAYSDYIVIKQFDESGRQLGDHCFLGLYTADVYEGVANNIPIIRRKLDKVVRKSHFSTATHNGKSLLRILETLPRDELFLIPDEELLKTSVSVVQLQERRKIKLFVHRPVVGGFIHCLVYVPRDLYRTELRQKIQTLLCAAFGAIESDFNTYFSESLLARTYFVLRLDKELNYFPNVAEVEKDVIAVASAWHDQFKLAAVESFGEEMGDKLSVSYSQAFSLGYQEEYSSRNAVMDIKVIQDLRGGSGNDRDIATSFFHPMAVEEDVIRFKVFHRDTPLALSDVLPILENHGLRVIGEHSYEIIENNNVVWLHDFDLRLRSEKVCPDYESKQLFQKSFEACWFGKIENDAFNCLTLSAKLQWHEVILLRAYARYLKQIRFDLGLTYIANALLRYSDLSKQIVAIFYMLFDPKLQDIKSNIDKKISDLILSFDDIESLSDDKIFRKYIELLQATQRTNFFQCKHDDDHCVSFKFKPNLISSMPKPVPEFEVFVYSARVEGVHLRCGKVSRGGLRWSDRLEDFRTEVLGLVKAQQVKNAVIVPLGAKGGFVPKKLVQCKTRTEIQEEGIRCYKMFIQGLLDITDNLHDDQVLHPENVVRRDDDDTYLVVAADKGTATFSDIANTLSKNSQFWLDDAFASGGSNGYDHKKMGITAKGAWVSVQQHFREMGVNVQEEHFSVVGIGDMGGDVFGNGMLLSEQTQLVAAFNHLHIFVDPCPDAKKSFIERKRLFKKMPSSWEDYDKTLLSEGGGVFNRSTKAIAISPEMQSRFAIQENSLTPTELISRLLKSPVDLIWNGGIGTYVKSSEESHSDAGDKANDILRINGADLRCRVFAEGGNLGMTQLGRVEFCLNGGRCNTDFIDNAAGVDCSDHEVNLKILLNELVEEEDLTLKQRNQVLEDQTDEVSRLVLLNNYRQTQAVSLSQRQVSTRFKEYVRYISVLEETGGLDRGLEFLPEDDVLLERKGPCDKLTRPELSVLLSYAKLQLKEELMSAHLEKDDYLMSSVHSAFPEKINQRFSSQVVKHRLAKEIIVTQLSNEVVNQMGIMFAQRMVKSTGSQFSDVIRAYVCIRDVYDLPNYWLQVEELDYRLDSELQMDLMLELIRLIRRATRWFLRNHRGQYLIKEEVQRYKPAIEAVGELWPDLLTGESLKNWENKLETYQNNNIPDKLAYYCAANEHLYAVLGIAQLAENNKTSLRDVAHLYFSVGDHLRLPWFALQLRNLTVENHWHAMARESYMDDLETQHRQLVNSILIAMPEAVDIHVGLECWFAEHGFLMARWSSILSEIQTTSVSDYPMYAVALRELSDLVQGAASDVTECSERQEMVGSPKKSKKENKKKARKKTA